MEIWIPAKNFPKYKVSSNGNVIGLKHKKILKPYDDGRGGYQKVDLYKGSNRHSCLVHRLVADSFFDGDHKGLEVNHLDGDKKNNFVGNLEWCTRSENLNHAYQIGLKKPPSYHPKQRKVRIVETGEVFDTINQCAKYIGGSRVHISQCIVGQRKTHKNYHFEAVD